MTLNVLGGDSDVDSSKLHLKFGHQNAQPDDDTGGPSAALDAPKQTTTNNTPTFITDVNTITKRLQQAQILEEECKIFDAAALLADIDPKHYQPIHRDIIKEAQLFRRLLQDSTSPIIASNTTTTTDSKNGHTNNNNTNEWIKQGEQHGNRHDFSMYYKVSPTNQITCRLETPIESQLLIPILAVLNESELYPTWIPSFKVPRLEVVKSEKLCQLGRVKQIILVETDVPWPIARRELILKAVACDDIIDSSDHHHDGHDSVVDDGNEEEEEDDDNEGRKDKGTSRILVRIQSLDCEDNGDDGLEILPATKGVRIKVDGGFVFEKCPKDHPMANTTTSSSSSTGDDNLILLTFTFSVDPKLSILPQSVLNFFLRTAMRQIWGMFLHVAEEVGDGKRRAHSEAIERKREVLYNWVEERTNAMLHRSKSK